MASPLEHYVNAIKVKGRIENGQLVLDEDMATFPWDGEVEVQVMLKQNILSDSTVVDPLWEAYLASETEREEVYQRLANV